MVDAENPICGGVPIICGPRPSTSFNVTLGRFDTHIDLPLAIVMLDTL